MKSSQLLAGNIATLSLTLLAFLQVLPWPTAGYLIIASALIAALIYFNSTTRKTSASPSIPEASTHSRTSKPAAARISPAEKPEAKQEAPSKAPRPSRVPARVAAPETIPQEKTHDAPTRIEEGDYLSLILEMEKGEEVTGEVSSTEDVNVYVLTEENLDALDQDQEFWYDAGNEVVRNATLRFTAPEDGTWFLVVENVGSKEAYATVKISVDKMSRSVPLLKTETLGLPDARLEGKL